jgi:nucleotide-binding universal stress UspA family protein
MLQIVLINGPFPRILVGYDDSIAAEAALRQSVALAEQYGGEIVAVHVADFSAAAVLPVPTNAVAPTLDPAPVLSSLKPYERGLFDKLCDTVATCSVPVSMEFVMNMPAAGILDAASRWNATAIAVGTHARRGLARVLIGSVADEVLRHANVAVIVTRQDTVRDSLERVIVGIDASEPSANASVFGVALSLEHHVQLLFCTVSDTASIKQANADLSFDPTPLLSEMRASARDALDAALQFANGLQVYPDTDVIDASDVGTALCEAAHRHDVDAIIIGSHRRSELQQLFIGSTAKAVILRADRPVIVIPAHAGFASGVLQRVHAPAG